MKIPLQNSLFKFVWHLCVLFPAANFTPFSLMNVNIKVTFNQ